MSKDDAGTLPAPLLRGGPAGRALQREDLGEFEERVHRRPGIGGALACLVILIVVVNFVVNGPANIWGRGVVAAGLLIVATWAYVWFRRVNGGLYLFSGGFVDAAGRRLVAVRWTEIRSVTAQMTQFVLVDIPVGGTLAYEVGSRAGRPTPSSSGGSTPRTPT